MSGTDEDEPRHIVYLSTSYAYSPSRIRGLPCELSSERLLISYAEPFVWHAPIDEIHDGTLKGLRQSWVERGLKAGTQNRRLGIITRILSLCARRWRHDNNKPWLGALPLIEKFMNRHYATPDIERLLMAAESILNERRTILRVVN